MSCAEFRLLTRGHKITRTAIIQKAVSKLVNRINNFSSSANGVSFVGTIPAPSDTDQGFLILHQCISEFVYVHHQYSALLEEKYYWSTPALYDEYLQINAKATFLAVIINNPIMVQAFNGNAGRFTYDRGMPRWIYKVVNYVSFINGALYFHFKSNPSEGGTSQSV